MTDACAAWVASHALPLFLLLPLCAAALAVALARACARAKPAWRLAGVAGSMILAGALFLALAAAVTRPGRVVEFDSALASALSMSMGDSLLWLLSWFTTLGDRDFLAVIAVLMTATLLARRQWGLAAFCAAATAGGGLLNRLLKYAFERVRPEHDHGFVTALGWSFPSGHASAAMAVYGAACYLAWRLAPASWRLPGVALAAALVMAIGLSRVLLQVHFASDVVAGFAISFVWLALCVVAAERLGGSARRDQGIQ
ncbi:phosphatase PAP2 family protein [Achromobacter ruhlandii]|uniref:Phosphatidic acid phosphatase type 2/haloperoxidase domain-containing protein n=1 Tax=Achromobacter ruhlandii TaxID=72557 RepID=A0ABM8LQ28_9BURK|nr:phosphatase PAP2 family protein [Achromobacter ruhlandii]AKP88748.1 Phosphatidylglycerophosphatase B [Achromobacter xylosoxidans]AOU91606.1 phosphatidylglycerophosphatase B [Achromobacter ruhlandii]MCZ8432665.1 phosphatase PAP2 family protein [Achromobacter ruhlandii]MDC6151517.1 phosphatase PAP2 family protein [Achromobacter ruhlandii]MDD7978097.1 phosphatase PAP2 family protein [Achromobacter ruhlandii]